MKRPALLLVVLAFALGMPLAGQAEQTCKQCHPNAKTTGAHSVAVGDACLSCHTGSEDHAASPMKNAPVRLGIESTVSAKKQNAGCLSCHEGAEHLTQWDFSGHADAEVPCAGCHSVHTESAGDAAQSEMCLSCHADLRADLNKRSRHPIKEGLVGCTDCHSPHGSANENGLVEVTTNDTCFGCHADKRGPFLYEHAPVVDDCANCHDPHGSVHEDLLTQRTPFLCQQCHSEAFHPSTLYDGSGLPGGGANNKLLADGCMNCHDRVHGSNHPSGPRLTR